MSADEIGPVAEAIARKLLASERLSAPEKQALADSADLLSAVMTLIENSPRPAAPRDRPEAMAAVKRGRAAFAREFGVNLGGG